MVAFIIFPTRTNNFNVESLRGQAIAKQLRETISAVQKDIGQRLFEVCLRWAGYLPIFVDYIEKISANSLSDVI